MKIAALSGIGLIGKRVLRNLRQRGHQVLLGSTRSEDWLRHSAEPAAGTDGAGG